MDEYPRAETAAQLVEIVKEYFPDEPRISEELAAKHLDEFNDGMATLEREGRGDFDVDWWVGSFVSRICNWKPPRPSPVDDQIDLIDAIADSIKDL